MQWIFHDGLGVETKSVRVESSPGSPLVVFGKSGYYQCIVKLAHESESWKEGYGTSNSLQFKLDPGKACKVKVDLSVDSLPLDGNQKLPSRCKISSGTFVATIVDSDENPLSYSVISSLKVVCSSVNIACKYEGKLGQDGR